MLFLLISSTSGYFGHKWSVESKVLKNNLSKAQREKSDTDRSLQSLNEILKPDPGASTLPLDAAVSSVMLEVFNTRVVHGVAIAGAVPSKSGGGAMTQVSALADAVPGSSLKSIKINMSGTYKSYPGLMSYLAGLQQGQVAVTRLKVQESTFELSVRVYGTVGKS